MCGIVGVAAFAGRESPTEDQVRRMCATITHRGPDDEGLQVVDGVGIGMRRLSIIDLSGGHQPMSNEDHTVHVVFNGEIYNYRELRCELEAAGHVFRTQSDTEVLVHAYEEHGLDFAERLNGMFALALHDARAQRVVLARDHLGIKPLYYAVTPRGVVWGSELKAVLASGWVERSLDPAALGEYLCWEYVAGERTLVRDVRKLVPASLLAIDLREQRTTTQEFWDVPLPDEVGGDAASWAERLDADLARAVRAQLISDVPLGAFLSGGVDSSLMVAHMGEAQTFSIGFDDPSYDELAWSQRVADHLGTRHTTRVISPDILDMFDRLLPHLDEPIGDFSIFPTYLVSALARESVTVALGGDGGDELFAGYETFVADALARRWFDRWPRALRCGPLTHALDWLPPQRQKKGLVNKAKRFLEGLGGDVALSHARWRLFMNATQRSALFDPALAQTVEDHALEHILQLARKAGDRDALHRSLYVDLRSYLCDNILVKVDRMSMATSLEVRVPYLDKDFVSLAFRVPSALKLEGGETKSILKQVAARHVPRACVYRPKQGFSIPIKQWLGTTLRDTMEDALNESRLRRQGLFQPAAVRGLVDQHLSGRYNHSHILWALIVFQRWMDRWMGDT